MKQFNNIIKEFNKTIKKLECLANNKGKEKKLKALEIADLEAKVMDIEKEQKSAIIVANKLKDIFKPLKGN